MVAQACPDRAAAPEPCPARSTREEVVPVRVQNLAQGRAQDLLEALAQGRALDSARAPAVALAEAASPDWLAESASSKKQNCTACSGCSLSSAKRNQPKILTSTHCRGG